ncbi:hypothetical protein HGRIS_006899 [Hohenbuehelia grisea]|uniref:Uncharacterized protein n=1 Tax=Hohenbuehelia grisea TaxID=104357 RepID=A0ABR3JAT9_9AGAR
MTIQQYNWSSHPYWVPNSTDAFTWSLPLVGGKIMEKLLAILRICSEEELADSDLGGEARAGMSQAEIDQRRQQIKNKILGVGRMQRVFQLLQCMLSTALLKSGF